MIGEEIERIHDEALARQYAATQLPVTGDALSQNAGVEIPPEDCPVHLRATPESIELAFFDASRPLPPFKLVMPREQWKQMVRLIAETAAGVPGFEAFVGFTPESLALHGIEAVEWAMPGAERGQRGNAASDADQFQPAEGVMPETENHKNQQKSMNNRKKTSLANRVVSLANKARAIYQKKDELFAQLLNGCVAGDVIETKSGRFEIVDNFAARNVGYRPASFHRYELKEVKAPKLPRKAAAVDPENCESPRQEVAA